MCLALRNTLRRGRSIVPLTPLRTRSLRRSRPSSFRGAAVMSLACLSGLLADLLALVTHALAAVRLWRAERADLGGRLPHQRLVCARDGKEGAFRILVDVGDDALGQRVLDVMREPEHAVDHVRALHFDAITGADQLE